MSDLDQPSEDQAAKASLSRRNLLLGAGLLAVGGAAYARMPQREFKDIPDEAFEALFPKSFANWRVLPESELIMPPEDGLAGKLYQHIVTRTYVSDKGEGVMFLVAYNSQQVNNVQVHRPEICYAASGFTIAGSQPYPLDMGNGHVIPTRIVRAERNSRAENIVYWTRIGDDFPQSWLQQRVAMTKANLEGFYADGLLVRASSINPNMDKSVETVSRFIREMAANSSKEARYLTFRI